MNIKKIKQRLSDQPDYRIKQIKNALFNRGVSDWDKVTCLPKKTRRRLKEESPLKIDADMKKSADEKTEKASILLEDGLRVEAVLMKYEDRNTVCVSSQVGCALGCKFCATGKMDVGRDLKAWEMIMQVYLFLSRLPEEEEVGNIVFMGMGEPFLNYEEVIKAIDYLNDEEGFNIGSRRISVSTAGLPDKIKRFAHDRPQVNLAVSLHAADNETRSQLMPINDRYPLEDLFNSIDEYIEITNRKVMFEYIPFEGINDKKSDIDNLVNLLSNRLHFINVIPYNPTGFISGVSEDELIDFKNNLRRRGLDAGIRRSFGQDIKGACGQLASNNN